MEKSKEKPVMPRAYAYDIRCMPTTDGFRHGYTGARSKQHTFLAHHDARLVFFD